MPVTSKPVATSDSTSKETSSTHIIVLSTTRSDAHSTTAESESKSTSSTSSFVIALTTSLHTSTTSKKAVKSSATIPNGSSQTSLPGAHGNTSHGVPIAAIVAAAAVSAIIILGIIYKLWTVTRSRRRGGQYGTTPLPPPRSSVFVQSTYSGAGSRHQANNTTTNSNSTKSRPSASDEAYSNNDSSLLKPPTPTPPTLMRSQRPASWISFDGNSIPRPPIPPPPPTHTHVDSTPLPRSPADPFASLEDAVHERPNPEFVEGHVPEIHGDGADESYRSAQETPTASPVDDDNDDRINIITSDPMAVAPHSFVDDDAPGPLPSYPSLPTASTNATYMSSTAANHDEIDYPLRPPRSPLPQAVPVLSSSISQQPPYPNVISAPSSPSPYSQSPRQSLYLRNSPSPIPPDPYPSSSSSPLDRRLSYASSMHTHLSGDARSSRYYGNNYLSPGPSNIGPGGIPRGAPHLPHVRAAVEIVLPTPLAPQMSGVPIHVATSGPSSSSSPSHAYRNSMYERGGSRTDVARRRSSRGGSQLQRSTSRASVNSDAWADVTLSARHRQPSLPLPLNGNASSSDIARVERVRTPSQSKSRSPRPDSQPPLPLPPPLLLPPDSTSLAPPPSPLLPPTRPWDDRNSDGTGSGNRPVSTAETGDSVVGFAGTSSSFLQPVTSRTSVPGSDVF
jgi:hypothetical protein